MRQYRRQLQAESVGFSDQPIENYQLTAREADLGRMAALSSQLRTRRSALWQELDDAQARALELCDDPDALGAVASRFGRATGPAYPSLRILETRYR